MNGWGSQMKTKLISKPKDGGDYRENIRAKELIIGQQVAEMVFELNPIFKECWVSFWAGKILWFTEVPEGYYNMNSFYYQKEN